MTHRFEAPVGTPPGRETSEQPWRSRPKGAPPPGRRLEPSKPLQARPVAIEIGELRLHGFDPHARHDLKDAIATELAHLLAREPLTASLAIERLDLGAIPPAATRQATARLIAREIAAALRAPSQDHRGDRHAETSD